MSVGIAEKEVDVFAELEKVLAANAALVERVKRQEEMTHAQCWSHARRAIEKAKNAEPALVEKVLLPTNPFSKGVNYLLKRKAALQVFLDNPDVPLDTNHLERELKPIPMGRKAWLFCWTEVGAHYTAVIQSLLVTCKLQGIDPFTYLVDLLQRVDHHLRGEIEKLIPRNWKVHFGDNPIPTPYEQALKNGWIQKNNLSDSQPANPPDG